MSKEGRKWTKREGGEQGKKEGEGQGVKESENARLPEMERKYKRQINRRGSWGEDMLVQMHHDCIRGGHASYREVQELLLHNKICNTGPHLL